MDFYCFVYISTIRLLLSNTNLYKFLFLLLLFLLHYQLNKRSFCERETHFHFHFTFVIELKLHGKLAFPLFSSCTKAKATCAIEGYPTPIHCMRLLDEINEHSEIQMRKCIVVIRWEEKKSFLIASN